MASSLCLSSTIQVWSPLSSYTLDVITQVLQKRKKNLPSGDHINLAGVECCISIRILDMHWAPHSRHSQPGSHAAVLPEPHCT